MLVVCCLQGSATLSMAYAGALFADACLRGLNGDPDVIECSYVASSITEVPFFSSKVKLGKNGELPSRAATKIQSVPCLWQRAVKDTMLVDAGPTSFVASCGAYATVRPAHIMPLPVQVDTVHLAASFNLPRSVHATHFCAVPRNICRR